VADYTPGYSFSGFQASSPAAPLPAPKLDAELGAIAAKLLDLRAMIEAIPIVTVVQQPTGYRQPGDGGKRARRGHDDDRYGFDHSGGASDHV
jgi:hypothetical protein